MGYGEVVGNMSVHWKMVHGNPVARPTGRGKAKTLQQPTPDLEDVINGRDPIDVETIGRDGGHDGQFRVTLRYESLDAARAALERASRNIKKQNGKYLVILDVPVRKRKNPEVDRPAEVRVDW